MSRCDRFSSSLKPDTVILQRSLSKVLCLDTLQENSKDQPDSKL